MAKAPAPTEHAIQAAYIEWVRIAQNRHVALNLLYAIPNGAAVARVKDPRTGEWSSGHKQASKLLREGLLPGILDIHLPVPGRGTGADPRLCIGLWIEFKRPGGTMSTDQLRISGLLREFGHRVELCTTTEGAIDVTEDYLGVPPEERTRYFGTGD